MIAGNYYKIRQDGNDGWGESTPLCREYSSFRTYPKTQALAAVPEGTIIRPVLEVHVVKILDGYGFANPEYTTYVVVSREEERSVSELHDHKKSPGPAMNCSRTFTNHEEMKKEK